MKKIILAVAAFGAVSTSPQLAEAYQGTANQHCREYTRTIYVGGKAVEGVGVSCLQADGSWRIVSTPQAPATVQQPRVIEKETVIYRDRYHNPYSYRSYYPRSSISISLGDNGYKHRHKRHHRWHHRTHYGHSWNHYPNRWRHWGRKHGHHH